MAAFKVGRNIHQFIGLFVFSCAAVVIAFVKIKADAAAAAIWPLSWVGLGVSHY